MRYLLEYIGLEGRLQLSIEVYSTDGYEGALVRAQRIIQRLYKTFQYKRLVIHQLIDDEEFKIKFSRVEASINNDWSNCT